MSKTISDLLLEVMQIYKEKEWEEKKQISKERLIKILDKITSRISDKERIDNKTYQKLLSKIIKELENDHVIETETNNLEKQSNIVNFWKKGKEYCTIRFSIKEIIFILLLVILLIFSIRIVQKNIELESTEKITVKKIFNEVLFFISNLLNTTH